MSLFIGKHTSDGYSIGDSDVGLFRFIGQWLTILFRQEKLQVRSLPKLLSIERAIIRLFFSNTCYPLFEFEYLKINIL